MDVQSKIYLRDKVGKLGVAPLTSMFLFGPNQPSPANNYRPELHDSNGLSIHAGNGEWIWRPLNPKHLAVSSFDGKPASVYCSVVVISPALKISMIVTIFVQAHG